MNQPEPTELTIEERLAAVQKKAAEFGDRWREWSHANTSNVRRCDKHAFDRKINEERSISVSWQKQEFVVIYKGCPGCWRDEHPTPEKKKKKGKNT